MTLLLSSSAFIKFIKYSDHQALKPLACLIIDLENFADQTGTSVINPLVHFYKSYLNRLVSSQPKDRFPSFRSKVILNVDTEKSYRISPSIAQQVISQDEYGLILKRETTGTHNVFSQGGIYFKGNTGAQLSIHPEMEMALCALSHAVFNLIGVVTPMTAFYLEGVTLKQPDPAFPETCKAYLNACNQGMHSSDFFTQYPEYMTHLRQFPPHILFKPLKQFLEKPYKFIWKKLSSFL